jgi:MinD-like ATPase involved in chromosome partitioning or flagellar assembly
MGVIVLGSAKGSPGVSTTALALAAAWPGETRPVVVEADPAGGDAMLRFGMRESPGLVSLAAASRRVGLTGSLVREHAQRLNGGVEMVLGPVEAAQCTATLDALGPAWTEAELDGAQLLVDCGRLLAPSGTAFLLAGADAVVLVSGGSVEALAHAAEAAQWLRRFPAKLVVAVLAPCLWPAEEVKAALGADGCVVLPRDPRSAALLRGARPRRRWWPGRLRHALLDSAHGLAVELQRFVSEGTFGTERPRQDASALARSGDPVPSTSRGDDA